jgi:hypothetical protein
MKSRTCDGWLASPFWFYEICPTLTPLYTSPYPQKWPQRGDLDLKAKNLTQWWGPMIPFAIFDLMVPFGLALAPFRKGCWAVIEPDLSCPLHDYLWIKLYHNTLWSQCIYISDHSFSDKQVPSLFINMLFISKFYWWLMGANPIGIGFPPIKMNL